ncbi:MAG TPA: tetratricopeptide repeat protein, partial [Thermoanaerobaculia bacterium]|nr:tetratricopeptide repeat protein [Thermoanaerobaculia bacterium]
EREKLLRESIAIREKVDPGSGELAFSLNGLGWFLMNHGRMKEAEPFVQRALEIRRAQPTSQTYQRSLLAYGSLLNGMERFDEAERVLREAIPIAERIRGKDDVQVGELAEQLGVALRERGDLAAGERELRRSLDIYLAHDSSRELASSTLAELGVLFWRRGDLGSARESLERSLAMRSGDAEERPATARAYWGLANVSRDQGDLTRAEALYRRALAIQEKAFPEGSLPARRTRAEYAKLLRKDKREAEAREEERKASTGATP